MVQVCSLSQVQAATLEKHALEKAPLFALSTSRSCGWCKERSKGCKQRKQSSQMHISQPTSEKAHKAQPCVPGNASSHSPKAKPSHKYEGLAFKQQQPLVYVLSVCTMLQQRACTETSGHHWAGGTTGFFQATTVHTVTHTHAGGMGEAADSKGCLLQQE